MILTDINLAIPIGIIYNILVYELTDMLNNNLIYDEKIQSNLIFIFFFGLLGFFLGYYLFKKNKKLKNNAIRYGLYFGSFLLLFNTLVYNWNIMANTIKLAIVVIFLMLLLFLSYKLT